MATNTVRVAVVAMPIDIVVLKNVGWLAEGLPAFFIASISGAIPQLFSMGGVPIVLSRGIRPFDGRFGNADAGPAGPAISAGR